MDLVLVGILVAVTGFAIMMASMLLSTDGGERQTKVKGGGVVMVGPIPIIFGSDARWTVIAVILAILLMVLSFVLYTGM